MKNKYLIILFLTLVVILATILRFWHIEFGLPHSFYADEPEIAEIAIKYTYEIKDIVKNSDYYRLIPVSFVYGTFPSYFMTTAVAGFSKFLNLLSISFDKTTLYIFMRVVTALISLTIPLLAGLVSHRLFKNTFVTIIALALTALNWKFIVIAHYVNADMFLAAVLWLTFYLFYIYFQKGPDNKYTFLSGLCFGVAVGTKVTALISFPAFLFVFIRKKDLMGVAGFVVSMLLGFIATNPFSLIFREDFTFRVYEMFSKEAGIVFDSADTSPFKYVYSLIYMVGIPVLLAFCYGVLNYFKSKEKSDFNWFLLLNILTYLLFFSVQGRRVDRWLLPTIPMILIIAAYGLEKIKNRTNKLIFVPLVISIFTFYLYKPLTLLTQFRRDTPKSQAYIWAQENIPVKKNVLPYVLVYTEEGLDPFNKLTGTQVFQYQLYTTESAQLFYPVNPHSYEYVVVASRTLQNYKNPIVKKMYPHYYDRWRGFEEQINDPSKFEMIKEFTLSKPNLIPLSDVYIYKNVGSSL